MTSIFLTAIFLTAVSGNVKKMAVKKMGEEEQIGLIVASLGETLMTIAERITDTKTTHAQLRAEPPKTSNLDGKRVAYDQVKAVLDECWELAASESADDVRKSVRQAANRLAADAAIAAGLEAEHAGIPRDEDFLGYYATLETAFGDQS